VSSIQFQTFHLFRNKVTQLTPEEVAQLKENEHMWSAQTVIQYLHALVRKAGIDMTKKAADQPLNAVSSDDKPAVSSMFKTLGYFSLIGLLRVNALLCDYPSALKALDPIDLRANRSMFTSVLACHVTLYYYMGLSYLLARRYVDAIKVFSYFLQYITRNKHLIPRSYQADTITKRVDQMQGLLGIAYVLSGAAHSGGGGNDREAGGQILDENLLHDLRDKLEDRLTRMRSGDLTAFEEVLTTSAPKFLTVSPPNYSGGVDVHTNALASQLKVFLSEVKQRVNMGDLYSYLKLFTTISISKLSVFLNQDDEATLALLLKLAHKSTAQRWVGGAPGDFVWQHFYEVQFTVVKDTIYVREQRQQRRFGDFFMRQIYKFEELTNEIKSRRPIAKA
jgi:translation initiation factor 3 subunit L